jgi:hypothetical protein
MAIPKAAARPARHALHPEKQDPRQEPGIEEFGAVRCGLAVAAAPATPAAAAVPASAAAANTDAIASGPTGPGIAAAAVAVAAAAAAVAANCDTGANADADAVPAGAARAARAARTARAAVLLRVGDRAAGHERSDEGRHTKMLELHEIFSAWVMPRVPNCPDAFSTAGLSPLSTTLEYTRSNLAQGVLTRLS